MAQYFIGMDCGGTKTAGVLADRDLHVLERAISGPGNPLSAGIAVASRSYQAVIAQLLSKAGLKPDEVRGLGAGVAGAGQKSERIQVVSQIQPLLPRATISVGTDGLIALLGAMRGKAGITVIAGTGSLVVGMDAEGTVVRGGGWGILLGDEGSAATMGRQAIQAMLRAEDGREAPTRLRSLVLEHFQAELPGELAVRIYRRPPTTSQYAELFPKLLELAEEGDLLARTVIMEGAEELAKIALAVARRLRLERVQMPLALVGGLVSGDNLYRATLLKFLRKLLPRSNSIEPASPPEIGALYLALGRIKAD